MTQKKQSIKESRNSVNMSAWLQKLSGSKVVLPAIGVLFLIGGATAWAQFASNTDNAQTSIEDTVVEAPQITSFKECVAAGYAVLESDPAVCEVPGLGLFEDERPSQQPEPEEEATDEKPPTTQPTEVVTTQPEPKKKEVVEEPVIIDCLPEDANQYDKTYTHLSTSHYLKTGTYAPTGEFYDAIKFAGLEAIVNSPKTVVFAPSDNAFSNLTTAQYDYLYDSPSNMRELLEWHIVTSCITSHGGVNQGGSKTIATLGGNVTYVPGGPGKLEGITVGIWDFFTKNGAVHYIGGFVDASSLP